MERIRIAVLVSGGGTNLQALLDAQTRGVLHSGEIVLVVSNSPSAYALTRAEKAGVQSLCLTKRACGGAAGMEAQLHAVLQAQHIDLIVLAGYLHILSESFVKQYPKRILNIHPSLIPAFCGEGYYGLRVHEAALARGVKLTGATVHYVNEIADGGEIILQKAVAIRPNDTAETLQKRVMRLAEWKLLPAAAELVSAKLRSKEEEA